MTRRYNRPALRPRLDLRLHLPAHHRGVPPGGRGPGVLHRQRVRQPPGRRVRRLLLRPVRRLARRPGRGLAGVAHRLPRRRASRQVTGMGNVFLGMNAHVNRDLPFVLAEIGLVKPDGTSRKADHDRVNDFLARHEPVPAGRGGQGLDPTLDDGDLPGTTSTTPPPSRPSSAGGSRRGATPSAWWRPRRPRPGRRSRRRSSRWPRSRRSPSARTSATRRPHRLFGTEASRPQPLLQGELLDPLTPGTRRG